MTAPLPSLYQEIILDHYRRPRNQGTMERPTATVSMLNPVCGDEISLQVLVEDGQLRAVRFTGHGCSISQASASMMTQAAAPRPVAEVPPFIELFTSLVRGSPEAATDRRLGDLRALAGVAKFPVRVKCALLPWNALEEALRRAAAGGGDAGTLRVEDGEGLPPGASRDLPL
jgi:nitrogen fixation NifU-like protein